MWSLNSLILKEELHRHIGWKFGQILFQDLKSSHKMYGSLRFCHPAILQIFMVYTASKELKIPKIAQVNQFFQFLSLICLYGDALYV